MKNLSLILIMTVSLALISVACNSPAPQNTNVESAAPVKTYYTCSMHPEIHSDKPDKCPKCGMELIKEEVSTSDTTKMAPADTARMK